MAPALGLEQVLELGVRSGGVCVQRALEQARDVGEAATAGEEVRDRGLVRAGEGRGRAVVAAPRLEHGHECRKAALVDGREGERATAREVHLGRGPRRQAVGVADRHLDRQTHVGLAELRLHGAVDEGDHAVHDRLAMLKHIDAVERDVEQPARLDRLEPLVEERGAVDGDLRAHLPRRVVERLFRRHVLERREIVIAERAAGGREREAIDRLRCFAPQALPDRGVLGVNRAQLRAAGAVLLEHRTYRMSSDHEHFLVRDRHGLPGRERSQRGRHAGKPARRDHHEINVVARRHHVEGLPGGRIAELAGERTGVHAGPRPRGGGTEFLHLPAQHADVAAGTDRRDTKAVRERPDHVKGLLSDRPGGAEDGDADQI